MNAEEAVIGLVRIGGALLVLRWAFVGSIAAIAIDLSDLFLMNLLDLGGVRNYQAMDKSLDLAYMATFLWVARRWVGPQRSVALGLFALRIVGVVIFEMTDHRWLLMVFPNAFEFWFVFVAGLHARRPGYQMTTRHAFGWLLPVISLKLAHEYVLHIGRWLDQYRATDLVQTWWRWLTVWD